MALKEYTPIMCTPYPNILDADFKKTMQSVSSMFKSVFRCASVAILPGSGTYAMEAVARHFANDKRVLVNVNGYFGFRWTEIFTQGSISSKVSVLRGFPESNGAESFYRPAKIEDVEKAISLDKPEVIFMSHVDTATGIILPHDYIAAVARAGRKHGAVVVLDCIASGCVWADMKELDIDVIVTAPQKAFYSPAGTGIVLLSEFGRKKLDECSSSSFTLDLKKWVGIMEAYEKDGFAYHATMPTTVIQKFEQVFRELHETGIPKLDQSQRQLGSNVRKLLEKQGLKSVASPAFAGPTVIVFYCEDSAKVVAGFKDHGYKIAGGFSFFLGEKSKPNTFRIGLFGLDKLRDVEGTTAALEKVIAAVFGKSAKL